MRVTAHCIVKNEDIWVWFAIQSVLPLVDKIIIFDTGSVDKTVDVIKSIKSDKIIFEKKGSVDSKGLVKLRQEQLDRTQTDWFLILDGDEIWPKDELIKLLDMGKKSNKNIIAVFNHVRNCVGDIYHYLPKSFGNYQIAGIKGNLNIRLIKKTKDLQILGDYPLEVYADKNDPIQNQDKNLIHSDAWYLHTSFLKRSSKVVSKVSGSFGKSKVWQKGLEMKDGELPEVFKLVLPDIVPQPMGKRGLSYEIMAQTLEPFMSLKKTFKK